MLIFVPLKFFLICMAIIIEVIVNDIIKAERYIIEI